MIQTEQLRLRVRGGSASANTKDLRGWCGLLVVTPDTNTTQYDLTLTDEVNVIVYEKTGIIGTWRDTTVFPIKGVHTVALTNVSADEIVTFAIANEESP